MSEYLINSLVGLTVRITHCLKVSRCMARPRSEEKRLALLIAAAEAVAEHGLAGSPTSLIAKKASVAEGTLFRYFPTKEDLLNELYFYGKQSLCEMLMRDYQSKASFRDRFQGLWNSYIDWGLANPQLSHAVNQLSLSSMIRPETLTRLEGLFPDMEVGLKFAESEEFGGRADFAEAIFTALAETTMSFASREPSEAMFYKNSGFAALWKMCEGR
ncbi:TetR/AcrR family transcriptional regulator [Pseudomonas sp. B2M1-30]|uniref:TetR/AcrR family transcriptional regulator n=1 Tax=Pseudomonas TaxID=286 RepID=UPI0021C71CD7|nr:MULTISPECIES: TetR/AcrR family transcriptional regulator [Pseudomonas]MCU0120527.1 TetR/AcrR family transcriptional regulator [Pseudomonas sp. B2M1-30]MCU7262545.1 TetR/AcrR family transcriptional regulator [Pseudomonas koreensis]